MQYYYHEQLTDLDATGFGLIQVNQASTYAPAHWHEALELLLFVQGSVTCKFSHSTFHSRVGDICLINSHDIHETRCSHNTAYLVVHILPSVMCRYMPDFDKLSFSLRFDPDDPEKTAALEELRGHMERIYFLHQTPETTGALEIHARLFDVVRILVTYFSEPMAPEETTRRKSDMTRLQSLLEYTRVHHAEELSLDFAADSMGLNRAYFCRLFKKNMGVSYLTYLNQIRATAVCRELETSDDPISAIGERHGFTNPKMLGQYFRELYGCTPSEKRKAFREMVSDGVY